MTNKYQAINPIKSGDDIQDAIKSYISDVFGCEIISGWQYQVSGYGVGGDAYQNHYDQTMAILDKVQSDVDIDSDDWKDYDSFNDYDCYDFEIAGIKEVWSQRVKALKEVGRDMIAYSYLSGKCDVNVSSMAWVALENIDRIDDFESIDDQQMLVSSIMNGSGELNTKATNLLSLMFEIYHSEFGELMPSNESIMMNFNEVVSELDYGEYHNFDIDEIVDSVGVMISEANQSLISQLDALVSDFIRYDSESGHESKMARTKGALKVMGDAMMRNNTPYREHVKALILSITG